MHADERRCEPLGEDTVSNAEWRARQPELAVRIIRSLIYVAAGAGFALNPPFDLLAIVYRPLVPHPKPWVCGTGLAEPPLRPLLLFLIQVSVLAGLILAVPLCTFELLCFIAPRLAPRQRKTLPFVGSISVGCFILGLAATYAGALVINAMQSLEAASPDYLRPSSPDRFVFLTEMYLVFGLAFEIPVLVLFLGWAGLIRSVRMRACWKEVALGATILASLAGPSHDAPSAVAAASPLIGSYFLSIVLVRSVEHVRSKRTSGC